jgi:hypothetical protein
MKTAEKKVTETKVNDNGQIEKESFIDKINSRIESTTKQYEESVKRSTQHKQQFDQEIDLQKRCLGALEISNNLKEELEPKQDAS